MKLPVGCRVAGNLFVCPGPVSADTYDGCTAGCRYCFAAARATAGSVRPGAKNTKRTFGNPRRVGVGASVWAERLVESGLPIHLGGQADPLQPCDAETGATLAWLRAASACDAAVILSTKFPHELLRDDLALAWGALPRRLLQVSICAADDRLAELEPGAPRWRERFEAIQELSRDCPVVVRVQPVMIGFTNFAAIAEQAASCGVKALTVEGYKAPSTRARSLPARVGGKEPDCRNGNDYTYTFGQKLVYQATARRECRSNGLRHYVADNALRWLGDSLGCCGQELLPDSAVWGAEVGGVIQGARVAGSIGFGYMHGAMGDRAEWSLTKQGGRSGINWGNQGAQRAFEGKWGDGDAKDATLLSYARRWWHRQLPQECPAMRRVDVDENGDPVYSLQLTNEVRDFIAEHFGEDKA